MRILNISFLCLGIKFLTAALTVVHCATEVWRSLVQVFLGLHSIHHLERLVEGSWKPNVKTLRLTIKTTIIEALLSGGTQGNPLLFYRVININLLSLEPSLLEESESLHKAALELSMMAFGEKNVQTAKHYGNLGRLYQSMQKFQVRFLFLLKKN